MYTKMNRWLLILMVTVFLAPSILAQENAPAPLQVSISPGYYFAPQFTHRQTVEAATAGITRFYYRGENIYLYLALANNTNSELTIASNPNAVPDRIQVRIIESPPGFDASSLRLRLIESPTVRNTKNSRIKPQPPNFLAPKDYVSLAYKIENSASLRPGVYRLRVVYQSPAGVASAEKGTSMAQSSRFGFTVVENRSFEDNLEYTYRQAMTALRIERNAATAIGYFQKLLSLYPNSSVAYLWLGELQAIAKNYRGALSYYQSALDLIDSGADYLHLQLRGRESIAHMKSQLSREIRNLGGN